jgi:hypothetical protein
MGISPVAVGAVASPAAGAAEGTTRTDGPDTRRLKQGRTVMPVSHILRIIALPRMGDPILPDPINLPSLSGRNLILTLMLRLRSRRQTIIPTIPSSSMPNRNTLNSPLTAALRSNMAQPIPFRPRPTRLSGMRRTVKGRPVPMAVAVGATMTEVATSHITRRLRHSRATTTSKYLHLWLAVTALHILTIHVLPTTRLLSISTQLLRPLQQHPIMKAVTIVNPKTVAVAVTVAEGEDEADTTTMIVAGNLETQPKRISKVKIKTSSTTLRLPVRRKSARPTPSDSRPAWSPNQRTMRERRRHCKSYWARIPSSESETSRRGFRHQTNVTFS